jgi:hypothetical protein
VFSASSVPAIFCAPGEHAGQHGQLRHTGWDSATVVVPASGMKGLGAQPLVGLRSIRPMGRMR